MDKLKYVKLENPDGSYTDPIALSVDTENIDVGTSDLENYILRNDININNLKVQSNNNTNAIGGLANGSPLVANSISEMIDISHVYVNTADGHWYYYNGNAWQDGGIYQATETWYDKTLTANNATPNSKIIGDKLNNIVKTNNLFDKTTVTNNKYINTNSVLINDNNYFLTDIISIKNGDTLTCYLWKDTLSNGVSTHGNLYITKVQANGTPILTTYNSTASWNADEDCFIRISVKKQSAYNDNDYMNGFAIYINYPSLNYSTINYKLIENKHDLDEISGYHNYLNNFKLYSSMSSINTLVYAKNFFVTNIIKCKIGDVFYIDYFNNDDTFKFTSVNKFDNNYHFIERLNVDAKTYTVSHDGYVIFTCQNINQKTDIDKYCVISKNEQLVEYVPPIRYILNNDNKNDVNISKIDSDNFLITFGKFKITLFKTDNNSTNSHNWNLKVITDLNDNVIVPQGTDIIGPIKLQGNNDFIGGVHGDETTNAITIAINGNSYDLENVINLSGNSLTIIIKSTCYDEQTKNPIFDRFINIIITNNKIHISNSFKALANTTLVSGPIGGLIACRNNIIKNIIFNNAYFNEAPVTQQNIASKYNTMATINTIYGSVTINNLKGYQLDSYEGYLQTFTNENPIRNKIYFMNYKLGTYSISIGDILLGEFEYLFS